MSTALRHIGKYELHERLARTPLSELWKAYDPHLRKYIALKLLATQTRGDPDYPTRFLNEIQMVATLHHPNIVQVHDARVAQSQSDDVTLTYITSDYVEGQTLAEYIRAIHHSGKTPNWAEIIRLFVTIATTIDYAHRSGIVHGDLKPTNIILSSTRTPQVHLGDPILTDFGIDRILGNTTNALIRRPLDAILYISPEQAKGGPAEKYSDIYSLCVMLYEICTGIVPFQGTRPISILMQHTQAMPQSPALIVPNIPSGLTNIIMRGLSKEPTMRFQSAAAMATALANALTTAIPMNPKEDENVPSYGGNTHLHDVKEQRTTSSAQSPSLKPLSILTGKRQQRMFIGISVIVLMALVVAGLGVYSQQKEAVPTTGVVGHASFVSTELTNDTNGLQGLNDELQIDLTSIATPASGNSYYAWLLPDKTLSEVLPIFVGKLPIVQGKIHFLYTNNSTHNNLLASTSRFLITEESATTTPTVPSLDTNAWRYYAELPQAASASGATAFTMLDHFRHLLVELPELQKYNLHGGLAVWLLQNARKVETLTTNARDAVLAHDYVLAHEDIIRIVDYLDGRKMAQNDLPSGTILPRGVTDDEIALLGGDVNTTDAPGYLRLVGLHLTGMLSLPPATQEQRQSGSHIVNALNTARSALQRVHDDDKTLASMSNTQLTQSSSLTLLDDMVTQSYYAYTGYPDQHTLQTQGGAIWIYSAIQRLVDYSVVRYGASQ